MKYDPHDYTISIQKVRIDGDDFFESTIKELPDASMYGESPHEAYELAIDTIETTASMLEEVGREMPAPIVKQQDFSGRVTLRIAKSLHQRVATFAEHEGVSLNSYINMILAENVGATSVMDLFQNKVNGFVLKLITATSQPNQTLLSQLHITATGVSSASGDENTYVQ